MTSTILLFAKYCNGLKFKTDFYAVDEDGETYLIDEKGGVLDKKAHASKKKLVYGVGTNDWSYAVSSSGGGAAAVYKAWNNMLMRGYDEKYNAHKPTYVDVSVSEEWKSFTNFFNDTKTYMKKGYHLDKDLLFFDNKEYSKQACIFVPQWLNSLLTDSGRSRGDLPQGVCWDKGAGAYRTLCAVDGKNKHLGYFDRIEEASNAYVKFKISYIESKREEIEAVASHNDLHIRFGKDFSLTDRVIENFKKQVFTNNSGESAAP